MIDGCVRRMAEAATAATGQWTKAWLKQATEWLASMCNTFSSGMQQLRGAERMTDAELRMLLSATATVAKNRGLNVEATHLFLWCLRPLSHSLCGFDSQHLHFLSLYMAAVHQPQPGPQQCLPAGLDWCGISPPNDDGPLHPQLVSASSNIIGLSCMVQPHLYKLLQTGSVGKQHTTSPPQHAASLSPSGPRALAVLTSGPAWAMFNAAATYRLHPFGRLQSDSGFMDYHLDISNVVRHFFNTSQLAALVCSMAATRGFTSELQVSSNEATPSSASIAALSPEQGSNDPHRTRACNSMSSGTASWPASLQQMRCCIRRH